MNIKKNQIYIWEEDDAILGFAKLSINGITEEFGGGYKIVKKDGSPTKSGFARNKAIRQVKIQFANVINALKIYGGKILDKEGNIDPQEFLKYEKALQRKRVKWGLINRDNFVKLKDLKVNMIDTKKSIKLGIGK